MNTSALISSLIASTTTPAMTADEVTPTALGIFADYMAAKTIGDEVAYMLAASSFYRETRRRLLDVSRWHVQYSEGGNAFEAEFTGDGTAVFNSKEAAEGFIAEFRGAWVSDPYHPPERVSLRD